MLLRRRTWARIRWQVGNFLRWPYRHRRECYLAVFIAPQAISSLPVVCAVLLPKISLSSSSTREETRTYEVSDPSYREPCTKWNTSIHEIRGRCETSAGGFTGTDGSFIVPSLFSQARLVVLAPLLPNISLQAIGTIRWKPWEFLSCSFTLPVMIMFPSMSAL